MEIDYIFQNRSFRSEKSARAKILTEWKTVCITEAAIGVFRNNSFWTKCKRDN